MKYKGYEIVQANRRGGKAGRGCNKTTSLQIREPLMGTNYLLVKQIRFKLEHATSAVKAMAKAMAIIDKLPERS